MVHKHIVIIVYQKYIGTSIKIGCPTRSLYSSAGPKTEGVPTSNQRGRGSGPCRPVGSCVSRGGGHRIRKR